MARSLSLPIKKKQQGEIRKGLHFSICVPSISHLFCFNVEPMFYDQDCWNHDPNVVVSNQEISQIERFYLLIITLFPIDQILQLSDVEYLN